MPGQIRGSMLTSARALVAGAAFALSALLAQPVTAQQGDAAPPPQLEFVFALRAEVDAPIKIGTVAGRERRIVPILGGTFEGPGYGGAALRGRVVPGGADYQEIQPDGFSQLEARYVLETEQGELIYVVNRGIRHAPPEVMAKLNAGQAVDQAQLYMRVVPTFETTAPRLQWLTRAIFITTGERHPNGVVIRFYRIN
ncbi:MAG: DUF3237 domain-containing protein [Gammaproteobacteria bacterium]|nr:DUF3237 domain-containing protein [Gammaproteobacteria bacterium]